MLEHIDVNNLPVNKRDYIKLVTACVKYNWFTFNGREYKQEEGLAMGSPLSAVMACLYMEMVEKKRFSTILPSGTI